MIAGYDWAWCTRKVLEIFFRMSRDTSSDLNVELHHLLHRETPNYRSFTTKQTRHHLVLPKRHRFVMDDRKFLWDSSVHNLENHANCFWGNQKCTWAKIPSFAKNYNRNAKKKVSEFEVKFRMIQAFECIDGTCIPLKILLVNSQDFLIISSTFRTYRLFVIVLSRLFMIGKVTLWTWNVNG